MSPLEDVAGSQRCSSGLAEISTQFNGEIVLPFPKYVDLYVSSG
jgi:hypothetical protein